MIPSGIGGPNYHQVNPNIPLQIGGIEVRTVPPPTNPVYIPVATDAQVISLFGENQPANPYLLSSLAEAQDIQADVIRNCPGIPSAAVMLRDAPEYYGAPLMPGSDGRRTYVLEFYVNQSGFYWHVVSNCGMLRWQRAIYPTHQWALDVTQSAIIRNPTTPSLPGTGTDGGSQPIQS